MLVSPAAGVIRGEAQPVQKIVQARHRPHKAVSRGALVLLMVAFGGALALKAWEERQTADQSILAQQSREALAVASHVRAELVSSRARMEGLLLSGASLDAIRRGVPFDAVGARSPTNGVWAQLADQKSVRVFAQDKEGAWISGLRTSQSFMPNLEDRTLNLTSISKSPQTSTFQTVDGQRVARACSPISGADLSACVSRAAPIVDLSDLNRILIYVLLLAAPALAVVGLLQVIAKVQHAREADAEEAEKAAAAASSRIDQMFEVSEPSGSGAGIRTRNFLLSAQKPPTCLAHRALAK